MDYELEVHPVGDASKAGDAISLRYWNGSRYEIIVVDGGTDDSGTALVEHIRRFYGENVFIDHVVSTHPDTDHACGLRQILNNFTVGTLWVHPLWTYASELLPYFADKRWTATGLEKAIRDQYPVIEELVALARGKGTTIAEPFQGAQIGALIVLSPQRWSYLRLVPQFRKTPEADADALTAENMMLPTSSQRSWVGGLIQRAAGWIEEHWDVELLREDPITAAENESSTVLYGKFGNDDILLTADAGINALRWAQDYVESIGLDITSPTLVQVPHHGSRSNVSPSTLDRLLGTKLTLAGGNRGMAVVSAPKDDTKHPRKMVMNAFLRRGYPVYKTQGVYFRKYSPGMPVRGNEVSAMAFGWFDQVEEYD